MPGAGGFVVHVWLPDVSASQDRYQVEVSDAGVIPPAASGRIERVLIRPSENNKLVLEVRSTDGSNVASAPLIMGLGFILAN
jgi:hypothetical protein